VSTVTAPHPLSEEALLSAAPGTILQVARVGRFQCFERDRWHELNRDMVPSVLPLRVADVWILTLDEHGHPRRVRRIEPGRWGGMPARR